ncbi:MAG: hypothetical protein U5L75_01695 [Candidatus Campbellbacteria bacterium]|nr:hypothetical protein [Candidatus Campbellbacteria bacterium]
MKSSTGRLSLRPFEAILFLSGVGILLSVPVIFFFEIFAVWVIAKVLYGLGVAVFLVEAVLTIKKYARG